MAPNMMVEKLSCTVAMLGGSKVGHQLAGVALLQGLAVAIRTRKLCSSGFNLGWHFFPLSEQVKLGCLVKF